MDKNTISQEAPTTERIQSLTADAPQAPAAEIPQSSEMSAPQASAAGAPQFSETSAPQASPAGAPQPSETGAPQASSPETAAPKTPQEVMDGASAASTTTPLQHPFSYGTPPKNPYPDGCFHARNKAPATLNAHQLQLKDHFERYGLFSLTVGLLAAFCFFRNPSGITYPMFVTAVYLAAFKLLPTLLVPVKKDSLFLFAAALCLAVNSCATASPVLHCLNSIAQLLLGIIFLLHQCYDDRRWNIGKYLHSMLKFLGLSLASLPLPFSHGIGFLKNLKSAKSKRFLVAFTGFCAGIPAVIYLGYLLASADAVFRSMIHTLLIDLLDPAALWEIFLLVSLFALGSYCFLGSACSMQISADSPDKRRWDPLAAVTFTAMICLLYLLFCGIQVLYLFGQKGGLPGDMTYAQYARQGFFQLLAVAVLNLCLVLNCLRYFRKSKALSVLLVIISLCTYVMIASAAYRMVLYVDAYSLTFLRIFVLWFLGLLSVLMLGVLFLLFKEQFPLFRWCLTAVILAYTAFAWCRPDYQIARYNIARQDGMIDRENLGSLLLLSADAAPAIAHAKISPELLGQDVSLYQSRGQYTTLTADAGTAQLISCLRHIGWHPDPAAPPCTEITEQMIRDAVAGWDPGILRYNLSQAAAWHLAGGGRR